MDIYKVVNATNNGSMVISNELTDFNYKFTTKGEYYFGEECGNMFYRCRSLKLNL